MSECGFNIWNDIIIPVIISPILLLLKVLYDKWANKKSKTILLKNKLKLEKIQDKLKNFYWPLYIRLLRDFDIWSRFTIYDNDFYDFIESDTESDIENSDNIKRCSYKQEKIKDDNTIEYINCNIPVHINSNTKGPLYCLRHHKYANIQNIEIISYNNNEISKSKIPIKYNEIKNTIEDIILNIDSKNSDQENNIELKINKISNEDTYSTDSLPGNLSGNKVGEISELEHFNKLNQIDIDKDIYNSLVETLLNNYEHINKLIIDNIYIAEPNTQIGKQLIRFMKFSTIINALIKSDKSIDPNKYDSPYPKKLLPIVEKKVFTLQKKYNELINNYYYK